ncbi:hypothetical protein HYPSUDRAFT_63036 [Hypholoma sublateritium FD-334 SS-4]|uniref:RlpA-like protein double-psi beta-barrel domain-containing protein n=1 Tax=Hypholoma sublateritium (strain FD-334 SS-4) TaxID=945553 RepID=A0A0D2LI78_HYPSF|nr:hypothetical protein HYPSUDRAFT_63036 [Hypholoma sublateritium FD-334 SS-4]
MYHFATILTVAVSFAACTSSLVIPRATQPKGWLTAILEPYDTYHARYMALSCETQHNTTFFDQCCHPLLVTESLSNRPAQCDPANDEEDLPFCDEGDDGETTTTEVAPATTTTPVAKAASTTPVAKAASTTAAAAPKEVPTTSSKAAAVPSPAANAASTPSAKAKAAAPAPSAAPASASSSSTVETGGFATFFYQNGVAGACGKVNPDSALIAAIDADRYGNTGEVSSLCGKQVKITNTNNKKSVTVTIADACPTCDNSNSIDLSTGAFQQIATFDEGIVPISWEFL